ncbi:MAG: DUF47 family protein [Clostridium sp.]|uniref:DUF47 domain-containing protein n=1 Tax=Clostridium sp. TaxID=1506 RepID=UPI003028DD53
MKGRKGNDYFEMLSELVGYSCTEAYLLNETLINFDAMTLELKVKEMHEIEHTADIKKHNMMDKLAKEFITPIERGDIIELAHQIDNITDAIEDVLVRVYMSNISTVREEALGFSKLIIKISNEAKGLIEEFRNFKKSTNIAKLRENINLLEQEGDKLYVIGIKKFYAEITDPIELIIWKDIFEYFEKCCDACEDVAKVVESVIMKNS